MIGIIGGSGFIGSALRKLLTDKKMDYISFDINMPEDNDPKCIVGNMLTGNALFQDTIIKCDTIIHLVAGPDLPKCQNDPSQSFISNLMSLQVVLDSCHIAGGKKIIFPSSAVVYGIQEDIPIRESATLKPTSVYAHHKIMCENLIKMFQEHFNIEYVILRLFNVYGRGVKGVFTKFVESINKGQEYQAYGLSQYRDFVYIGDVANAIYSACTSDKAMNKTINIGSGEGMQIREILDEIKRNYTNATYIENKANTILYDHIADISKAKLLLDYKPITKQYMSYIIGEEICIGNTIR